MLVYCLPNQCSLRPCDEKVSSQHLDTLAPLLEMAGEAVLPLESQITLNRFLVWLFNKSMNGEHLRLRFKRMLFSAVHCYLPCKNFREDALQGSVSSLKDPNTGNIKIVHHLIR